MIKFCYEAPTSRQKAAHSRDFGLYCWHRNGPRALAPSKHYDVIYIDSWQTLLTEEEGGSLVVFWMGNKPLESNSSTLCCPLFIRTHELHKTVCLTKTYILFTRVSLSLFVAMCMYAFPLAYKMWQKIQRKRKFIPVQISRVAMVKKKY
jgi:hypothetical protein